MSYSNRSIRRTPRPWRVRTVVLAIALGAMLILPRLEAQDAFDPQKFADEILEQVAKIRGLEFKHGITAKNQSVEDFGAYIDAELDGQMPDTRVQNLGAVVRKLGLYRGPEIGNFNDLAKNVMMSQAAAYYDPKTEAFYVVMGEMNELMMGTIYSHELYHGLQDQYWDLDNYILSQAGGELNDDQLMARQAVVEGEATLVMMLWTMKKMMGSVPDRAIMNATIQMQVNMDTDMLRQMVKSEAVSETMGEDMKAAFDAMDDIPSFMLETLVGAYMKGLGFVFHVQGEGWEKVEELYSNPPSSTEQILHPEKWLAGEDPFVYEWPDFEKSDLLADWEVLDSNVVGEMQWRIIFREHEASKEASMAAAAGWDGDAYTVLRKKGGEDLMLLLATSWDNSAEALEFAEAYIELLKVKYPEGDEATEVRISGTDVLIAEGGEAGGAAALVDFIADSNKSK